MSPKVALGLSALLSCTLASSANAHPYMLVSARNGFLLMIDKDSIHADGNLRTFSQTQFWATSQAGGVNMVDTATQVDCSQSRIRYPSIKLYHDDGYIIENRQEARDWVGITKNTIASEEEDIVCKGKNNAVVDSPSISAMEANVQNGYYDSVIHSQKRVAQ